MFEIPPQIIQRILDGNQRRGSLVLTFRILGVIPDDDADALEDMQLVRGALICAELAFNILIKCLRLGQRFLMGKMASAWRAANFLPSSDAPAWK